MGTAIESTEAGPAKKRSSVRRWFVQAGLGMGMALGIVAVASTPAFAASSTCTISWLGTGSCTTGSVPPYPTYNWVDWRVSGGAAGSTSWYMFDDQGRRVASGTVPAGKIYSGTVTGLVNPWYKIHISSSYAGFATIENNP